MTDRIKILIVANKILPTSDPRIMYAERSKECSLSFALPKKTETLSDEQYYQVGFGEGFRAKYLLEFIRLFIFLRKHRHDFDLVHFYSTNLFLFGPIVAYLANIPCVITINGYGRTFSSTKPIYIIIRPIYLLLLKMATSLAENVYFQNNGDMQFLLTLYPNLSEKTKNIGSAISIPIIRHKDFDTHPLSVLLVTRLMPEKGILDFLEVAGRLNNDKFIFLLVGPPSIGFDDITSLLLDHNQSGTIQYLGELDKDATLEKFRQSHLFYFPSFYGEGMSRVMLESGFCLLCPIAYDIPANKDLIDNGRGFLVSKGDTAQVIRILNDLEQNRYLLKQNAQRYQEFVVGNFNIELYTQRLDKLYSNMS